MTRIMVTLRTLGSRYATSWELLAFVGPYFSCGRFRLEARALRECDLLQCLLWDLESHLLGMRSELHSAGNNAEP